MANLTQVLRQLEDKRSSAQEEVQRLGEAIAAIQKLVTTDGRIQRRTAGRRRGRRKLSAASRRKIALAQKARWARVKQEKKAA
jgi:hypothetical protein